MKNKKVIIIGIVILVLAIAGWYFFSKKSTALVANPVAEAWEKEVLHNMAWMRNDSATVAELKRKAKEASRTYDQQLRLDAEWYAEQNGFQRP